MALIEPQGIERQDSVSPLLLCAVVSACFHFSIPSASRKELTTNPSPFSLLFLSFFVRPMPLSSLQALVIPMLPYLTELCSTSLAPSFLFLCGIFAVPLPGMPSVVSVHYLCRDMVPCTSSWASAMSVLHCLFHWDLFNRIVTPFPDGLSVNYSSFSPSISHLRTVVLLDTVQFFL